MNRLFVFVLRILVGRLAPTSKLAMRCRSAIAVRSGHRRDCAKALYPEHCMQCDCDEKWYDALETAPLRFRLIGHPRESWSSVPLDERHPGWRERIFGEKPPTVPRGRVNWNPLIDETGKVSS